ncbi:MAG TPA: hypothetical protein VNZ52_14010, partial [Candidatus Thermoplasmatota archaeon]|nr:hypothetical protein [Candidatus Thermoplasmatota archaeon]
MNPRSAVGFVAAAILLAALPAPPTAGAPSDSFLPPFLLTVLVEGPSGTRDTAAVGMAPGATAGYDRGLDRPQPPAPPAAPWVVLSV